MAVRAADGREADRAVFCSIATPSHAAAAFAALRSVGTHTPQVMLALLWVDASSPPSLPGVCVVPLADCVETATFAAMRDRYTDPELCFALKPYLLLHLLRQGHAQAHYVDGDCLVFGDLSPLLADLDAVDLLLTPHSLTPIPDDGLTPRALTVLRAGVFNGGYIGARNGDGAIAFLRWLGDMTRDRARNAPAEGMCGDQRWLDLAPVLAPGLGICRRAGANVGYWNLHERVLTTASDQGFRVNQQPLLFFHFSGYDPAHPDRLSRHQNRHAPEASPALAQLLRVYDRHLAEATAEAGLRSLPKARKKGRFAGLQAILGAAITEEKR